MAVPYNHPTPPTNPYVLDSGWPLFIKKKNAGQSDILFRRYTASNILGNLYDGPLVKRISEMRCRIDLCFFFNEKYSVVLSFPSFIDAPGNFEVLFQRVEKRGQRGGYLTVAAKKNVARFSEIFQQKYFLPPLISILTGGRLKLVVDLVPILNS